MSERPTQAEIDEANASHAQEVLEQEWQEEFEKYAAPYGYPIERSSCNCGYCFYKDDDTNERFLGFLAAKRSSQAALAEKDRKIAELERDCKEYSRHINELDDARKELTRQNEEKDRKIAELVEIVEKMRFAKRQAETNASDAQNSMKELTRQNTELQLRLDKTVEDYLVVNRQNTEQAKLLAMMREYIDKAIYADSRNEMQAILEEALSATSEVVDRYLNEVRAKVWDSASEVWNLCTCCWSAEQVAAIEEISDECLKKADELRV